MKNLLFYLGTILFFMITNSCNCQKNKLDKISSIVSNIENISDVHRYPKTR
jgi:hypothetical protein